MDLLSMAELLKLTRLNHDIAQEDVASELGVHKNTVANWENGRHGVPSRRLRQLEKVYGLPEGYFDDYSDPVSRVTEMAGTLDEVKKNTEEILSLLRPKKRRT